MRFVSGGYPSTGTGIPQSMSRVIARGFRFPTRESEKLRTFARQLVFDSIQGRSRSANCGKSRKRCFVSRNSGVEPSMMERGLIRSEFRSEEHTSELQSQSNLVCRLLLEKKKPQ